MHALLIDDEVSARTDLREKLAAHSEVSVVGEAATISATRALLANADYDLVFLDVQLVGGETFQLLSDVRPGASIVFVTAHDRYAVRAFASNAVDYLLKPVDPVRLAEAVRRAAAACAACGFETRLNTANLPNHSDPGLASVDAFEVSRPVTAAVNSSEIALTGDERVYLRQCLEAWEDSLPPKHALRKHSSTLRRKVSYERGTEPTRLFIAGAPESAARACWRAIRSRFSSS